MAQATQNTAKVSGLHNFSRYLLSDAVPTTSPSVDRPDTKLYLAPAKTKVPFRAMVERVLRVVTSRKPKAFQPNPEQAPSYLVAYVTETLECGHKLDVNFIENVEPLIAKRRSCQECATLNKKKPSQSVRNVRRMAGESPWWAISFAIVSASLLVFGVFLALQPEDFYQVTERRDDYNLTIQRVHRGKPSPPWVMSFCSNTPAPFEAGHTLTALDVRYDKDKVCYALDSFSLLRDKSRCPVVPRNCMHTDCANRLTDHVICYGTPQFN